MDERPFDLHTFTEKLASEMGEDWEAITPGEDHWHEKAHIRQRDQHECTIYLRLGNWAPKGMIHLMGALVNHPRSDASLRYHEQQASINVAQTKTPGQVAKDIHRRLLPTYLEQLARNQAHVAACVAYETVLKTTEQAIAAIESAYHAAHPYSSGQGYYLHLEADGAEKVKLRVDGLPLWLVQRIIDVLG